IDKGWRLVIDADVVTQFTGCIGAFFRAAGDADRSRAGELGQLTDHSADRARRRGHDNRLALFRRDDFIETVPGGNARHADRTEISLDRNARSIDHAQIAAFAQRIVLPAAHADDLVANLETLVVRGDDLADRTTDHDRAELLRLGVGFGVVHATAHVR